MRKQRPRNVKYITVGHTGEKNEKVFAFCNNRLPTFAHFFLRYCKNPWDFASTKETATDAIE